MHINKVIEYTSHTIDHNGNPTNAPFDDNTVFVGWQCGFEPMFVAVNADDRIDEIDAESLAIRYLRSIKWFANNDTEDSSAYEAAYVVCPNNTVLL